MIRSTTSRISTICSNSELYSCHIVLSLRIALRYLLSRKSHGAVNIISAISLAAIAVAAAAMVIVLSVFNGFTHLADSKLSAIDPDYMVVPSSGKTVAGVESLVKDLSDVDGVSLAAPEITEQAFAVGGGSQMPVTVKGMHPEAISLSGIRDIIVDGSAAMDSSSSLLSVGGAMNLSLRPSAGGDSLTIYEPRRIGRINPANPMAAFRSAMVFPVGVYQVEQEEYDRDMVVVPFETAASLLNYSDEATSVAVYLTAGAKVSSVAEGLREVCQKRDLVVKDRRQQQQQAFRMIAIEKWITFLMLAFILIIASFNIISTLSMLIIEKEGNMAILSAMGATRRMVSGIFVAQGWLIIVIGGMAGMLLGTVLVLCQQHFGFIKLGASDPSLMSIEVYPVMLRVADLLVTFLTIVAVALAITPVIPLIRKREAVLND